MVNVVDRTVLFHPGLTAREALAVAESVGGKLRWQDGQVRIVKAQSNIDAAFDALCRRDYDCVADHLKAARAEIDRLRAMACTD